MENMFREYSERTSIHGVQYLGEKKRTNAEKIFWIIVLVSSFTWCIIMITSIWNKWDTNPITVTFDDSMKDIADIAFPAITVCPTNKLAGDDVALYDQLVERERNSNITFTEDEIQKMISLLYICDDDMGVIYRFQELITNLSSEVSHVNIPKSIIEMQEAIQLKPKFYFAKAIRTEFQPYAIILNEEGICYSYNVINYKNMFRKHVKIPLKYGKYMSDDIRKAIGPGRLNGLVTTLRDSGGHNDPYCNGLDHGYKFLLHSPDEFPSTRANYFHLPFDTKSDIVIEPTMITIDDEAKNLPVHIRQCYLVNERHLKFFKIYNQNNCEVECLANRTASICKCTLFYMPRVDGISVCNVEQLECTGNVWTLADGTCDCLPNCDSISYNAELYTHPMDVANLVKTYQYVFNGTDDEALEENKVNQISIYFKNSKIIPLKRITFYGWSDFIANCGGLLGLFMGVSILSVVEIFYFWVVRACYDMWNKKRSKSNGTHDFNK